MVSLCYPYGSPITCVCDPRGHVYNCFPTDTKGNRQSYATPDLRRTRAGGEGDTGVDSDQRTEIVLATTALVAVVALFLSFLIYRLEKYLVSNGYQLPLFHQCSKHSLSKVLRQKNSSSAQTDPVIYCYSHSQTVVGITHLASLPAPHTTTTTSVYPALPPRRFSYSPDSVLVNSARPSMSSTLPLPRSRSRSSPYESSVEQKSDQVSTPIELKELHYIDRASEEMSLQDEPGEPECYQEQEEEEVHFTEMYNSSSQQPLLDFMKLAEMEHGTSS